MQNAKYEFAAVVQTLVLAKVSRGVLSPTQAAETMALAFVVEPECLGVSRQMWATLANDLSDFVGLNKMVPQHRPYWLKFEGEPEAPTANQAPGACKECGQ